MRGQEAPQELREKILSHYEEWENQFGYGPCGEIACLLRERGFGPIAVCMVDDEGPVYGFVHYVNLDPEGAIIDVSLPFAAKTYRIEGVLEENELPEMVPSSLASVAWWRERI